ncbi:MAG: CAP domain-containing protein [Solirubrobacterales bacterium]
MIRLAGAVLPALAMLAAWLLPAGPAAAAGSVPCGNSTWAPKRLTLREMRESELCLINRVRAHFHLRKLAYNEELRDSATGHSDSMVAHHYFAHEGPGGSMDSRITRTGYLARASAFTIGENIGGGHGRRWGSPMAVFEEWMHSPPHRANILDPSFRDAGVGVARGYPTGVESGSATYTVDFGARSR